MKIRDYIFEFEDLSWFPSVIRESMMDYLRYLITAMDFYKPVTPLILEGFKQTNASRIIDLCSGGGGAIEQIHENLVKQSGTEVKIILTDKYPNTSTYEFIAAKTNDTISFSESPVDAARVPENLDGFRTIFSGFHHFGKDYAKSVLRDAVSAKAGIGIFDGGDKHLFSVLAILIMHPVVFFLFTPFFRPFRFSRLFFTYILPIIPFCTIWDGIVSIIRLYKPKELLEMAMEVEKESYVWKSGRMKSRFGLHVTYLTGYPKSRVA
jgi:hypothetical protein